VYFLSTKVKFLSGISASSQVNSLPIAKSQTRSKQNKGMHKCSSVYGERGVLLPVFTSAPNMYGHAKMPPASHQFSAISLRLMIQQIHPHVRDERDSGMCVARDLYELWGRSPYTRMFVARTSH
jgi:hypothetical protein